MKIDEIARMSRDDTDMKNIRQCLLSGDWNQLLNKQYLTVKQELSAVGDIVLRGTRLVIPRQMRDQIRYHCPVIGFINYPKTPTKPFTRKIWLYEHADYEKLRHNLINVNWDSLFLTDDIELITNDITNAILSTGTRIPDPPFSSFGPSRDYGMDLCLEVYL